MLKQYIDNRHPAKHVTGMVSSLCSAALSLAMVLAFIAFSTSGCSTARKDSTMPARAIEPSADLSNRHQQAVALMRQEQWQAAVDSLVAITSEQPALSGPWLNLGIARTKRGNGKAAEDAFKMAIETNPDNVEAYNQLGILYRRTGRPDEAQLVYETALTIEPDATNIHWNLAILHDTDLPDPDKALLHYQRYQQITESDDPYLRSWISKLVKESETTSITAEAKP